MQNVYQEAANQLDSLIPDWYKRINTYTLYMGSMSNCILGQLYGDFSDRPEVLKANLRYAPFGHQSDENEWVKLINERKIGE